MTGKIKISSVNSILSQNSRFNFNLWIPIPLFKKIYYTILLGNKIEHTSTVHNENIIARPTATGCRLVRDAKLNSHEFTYSHRKVSIKPHLYAMAPGHGPLAV